MKRTSKTPARYVDDLRFHLLNAARCAKAIEDGPVKAGPRDKARRLKEAAATLRSHASELQEEIGNGR